MCRLLEVSRSGYYAWVRQPESPQALRRRRLTKMIQIVHAESEVKGVKLSGVTKGAPAEQSGVRGGDVVVELAGKKIENIYDYTYAIEALKIGEKVKIVVRRG